MIGVHITDMISYGPYDMENYEIMDCLNHETSEKTNEK